jgi:hypothetical protein
MPDKTISIHLGKLLENMTSAIFFSKMLYLLVSTQSNRNTDDGGGWNCC